MKTIWLIALAAAMCGCQREDARSARSRETAEATDAARASLAPGPATTDDRPVIECFGDSLTAGFGVDPGQSYPDVLQREVDRRGYRYRVLNLGVSGETTQDGVARLPAAVAEKPAVVVLEFGANDGLRGLPVSAAAGNLAQVIEAFRSAGSRVVLAGMTLPPNYGPEYIRSFEEMYRKLASKYSLPLIPFLLEGVAGNPRLMQQDGLHPNAEGTRRVAATVFRAIEPLLKKT